MTLTIGETLERRYKIEKKLGEGGFGAVYRAYDTRLDVFCAVKESFDLSEEASRQFKRGASMLANLRHPHLPRVTDFFDIPNKGLYLVMDFVQGEDLLSRIQRLRHPLSEEQVMEWLLQICDALIYIHSQNPPIIHRDIKPQNIIIDQNGNAILVDFGLAKIYESGQHTFTGARGLTPGFAPVEQYGTGATDVRSDVFSLGATAYAMLTAQMPPESVQRVVNSETLLSPRAINPHISRSLSDAIVQAMEIDPRRRPQTAQEFLNKVHGEHKNVDKIAMDDLVSSTAGTAHQKLINADNYFNMGINHYTEGDLDGAIQNYSEAIHIQPDCAEAYCFRGKARNDKGDYDGAILDFTEAIRIQPDYVIAYFNRGKARSMKDSIEMLMGLGGNDSQDGAIQDYTKAIHIKPDYAEAYNARGHARLEKGDLDEAVNDFTEAIRLDPNYDDAYCNRACVRGNNGDLDGAIKDFTEAIRIKPDFVGNYIYRGKAYNDIGDLDGAIQDYTEAIRLEPDDAIAHFERGEAYRGKGDSDGAVNDFTEAIRLDPNYAQAYCNRGFERNDKGDYDGAILDFTEAIRIEPDYAIAYYNRGYARSEKGDLDGAIKDCTEAIRFQPDYAIAYGSRGFERSKKGDLDGAISDFTEAIRIEPDYAIAYYNRGYTWKQKGGIKAAIADYQKYLDLGGGLRFGDHAKVEGIIQDMKKKIK